MVCALMPNSFNKLLDPQQKALLIQRNYPNHSTLKIKKNEGNGQGLMGQILQGISGHGGGG